VIYGLVAALGFGLADFEGAIAGRRIGSLWTVILGQTLSAIVMSGSGDMLPVMIERSARLGLARHVHFTGFLKGEEVELMYAMADIFVMPSVSEPFGITPLEAMALDTPVIVSRQSGVSEVLRNALKVDFWDVEDIANKILALLGYPALVEQLTSEGRDEIQRLRWEHPAGLVRDVYRELVP
jgi:glycosyltransferase involved in cell wall biosynthesis